MAIERNFGLDLLRSIAIILVVIAHSTYIFVFASGSALVLILRTMGDVGVDLFFVLSGFLIGGLLLNTIDADKPRCEIYGRFGNVDGCEPCLIIS